MNLQVIEQFFFWCSIINLGLLFLSLGMIFILKPIILKTHSKIFGLPEDYINKALYLYIGCYKIFIWVFNIIPLISIKIISS